MLPEESGLRRELAQRSFRSPDDVWPAVRRRLLAGRTSRPAAAWSAVLAVVLVIVLLALLRGRPGHVERRVPGEFAVTNVRSLGRPATSIVLRPDPRTLMVVVD